MKILVIYHSGVGSTKLVAKLIAKEMEVIGIGADVCSIEEKHDISEYDLLCIGFPTYHAEPSKSIVNYIEQLSEYACRKEKCAFIFTTCGLYSGNALRIFAKKCIQKNIIPIYDSVYKSAATDGTLLLPKWKIIQKFQKNIDEKIKKDIKNFIEASKKRKKKTPRFKIHAILNAPNKWAGKRFSPSIYLHKECCIKCNKCVRNCLYQCLTYNEEGYPIYEKENCEHCYRCIHYCPNQALTILKNKAVTVQLNEKFFTQYEASIKRKWK